jgi:hypothetical protein
VVGQDLRRARSDTPQLGSTGARPAGTLFRRNNRK